MQEIADIDRLAAQLGAALSGRRLLGMPDAMPGALDRHLANMSADDLRPRVVGTAVHAVRRRGRHLLLVLRTGWNPYHWFVLQWQLNASGWLVPCNAAALAAGGTPLPQPHANFSSANMPDLFHLDLDDGQRWAYRDQRRWGRLLLWSHAEVVQGVAGTLSLLGPDWLSRPQDAVEAFREAFPRSHRSVKRLLLDQRVAAGIDNVLACEILHAARLHPERRWDRTSPEQKAALASTAASEVARRRSGTVSLEVFGRTGDWCLRPDCIGSISTQLDSKNSTQRSFLCPACQPHPGDTP